MIENNEVLRGEILDFKNIVLIEEIHSVCSSSESLLICSDKENYLKTGVLNNIDIWVNSFVFSTIFSGITTIFFIVLIGLVYKFSQLSDYDTLTGSFLLVSNIIFFKLCKNRYVDLNKRAKNLIKKLTSNEIRADIIMQVNSMLCDMTKHISNQEFKSLTDTMKNELMDKLKVVLLNNNLSETNAVLKEIRILEEKIKKLSEMYQLEEVLKNRGYGQENLDLKLKSVDEKIKFLF